MEGKLGVQCGTLEVRGISRRAVQMSRRQICKFGAHRCSAGQRKQFESCKHIDGI